MPSYVATDSAHLHYDRLGDDDGRLPPLVVLAGGAARHPQYLGDLAGLSQDRPLVVPHLRGVGRSPAPMTEAGGSFWRQAEDLEALREHLGLETVTVVAHSAGTRLALAWAVRFPQRVDRLVLVTPPASAVPGVTADGGALLEARRGEPAADAARAAMVQGPDLRDDAAFTAYNHTVAPVTYARWTERERAHALAGRWNAAAATAWFSVPPPDDLAERLTDLAAPVLVVAGADDGLVGPTPPRVLVDRCPRGALEVLADCGHYPWVEQPEAFRRAVGEFLAPGPAAGRS